VARANTFHIQDVPELLINRVKRQSQHTQKASELPCFVFYKIDLVPLRQIQPSMTQAQLINSSEASNLLMNIFKRYQRHCTRRAEVEDKTRAVEPEPKQFWMAKAGSGAKNFYMEPEPEWGKQVVQIINGL